MTNEEFQLRLKQAEDLSEIKAIVTRMDHALFGNGQPGIIQEYDKRIGELEDSKNKGKGAIWALSGLFTALGGVEVLHWFNKK